MRVLFLNYEYPPLGGGAANATLCLLEEFSLMQDIEVELVTSSIDNKYRCDAIGKNIVIHRLPIGKNSDNLHYQSVWDLLSYTKSAYVFSKKLLREKNFDVISAFFTVPCGAIAMQLHEKSGIPYIVSLRGSDVPGYSDRFTWMYPLLRPIVRSIWEGSAQVIANSVGLRDLALKTDASREIGVIPNGVDVTHFVPRANKEDKMQSSDKIRLTLGASRVTDRKGIHYLIEAIEQLSDECDIAMTVIGEGNAKERLERMVQEKHLESRIDFVGRIPREETLPYYQEADIFVLPSLNEGMSNAMLEALACGLPIISTPTGGAEELVREGENGMIVRQENVDDLVIAIRTLANDKTLRAAMGRKSREIAESMSWQSVAQAYVQTYEEAVSKIKK